MPAVAVYAIVLPLTVILCSVFSIFSTAGGAGNDDVVEEEAAAGVSAPGAGGWPD